MLHCTCSYMSEHGHFCGCDSTYVVPCPLSHQISKVSHLVSSSLLVGLVAEDMFPESRASKRMEKRWENRITGSSVSLAEVGRGQASSSWPWEYPVPHLPCAYFSFLRSCWFVDPSAWG